ncbi:CAP domain-containing protein [Blastococcus sp. PRF04-17]|uniref:CAP domain-containing protein n=1 Tax=Blastococcus sp. PRF04-17 TaxID=2933797 RepID=UPI001FF10D96|nr:CAP domain-containing protein [Blastococcus sp. PRF04-17]UOY01697.1 CAP domain-containing protein [Blastococcus sp. PRF04-17]
MVMPRWVLAVVAALLIVPGVTGCVVDGGRSVLTGSGPTPEQPPEVGDGDAATAMARDIFDRVNDERAERGLEPVEWNGALAEAAGDWSQEMAATGRSEHQDVRALMDREEFSGFAGIGENIFTASGPVPAGAAHVGWMRSDDHRINLLNPGWNRLGIGVFCAADGSVWATQQFGRTVDADRPPVSDELPPLEPIARPEEDGPTCV